MIKVFVLYHRASEVFRSEVFEPLQTGCARNAPLPGFLHDNDGDSISEKNVNFAELTGNYWVWKNYLPAHPEVTYVGFCHYRRNWHFDKSGSVKYPGFTHKMTYGAFRRLFKRQSTQDYMLKVLDGYDILLPEKLSVAPFGQTVFESYRTSGHPVELLESVFEIVRSDYPEYVEDMDRYWNGADGYYCLNYIMRRSLFDLFMNWIFGILNKLDAQTNWSKYGEYTTQKAPAYLAERLINVWLLHEIRTRGLRIRESRSLLLCDPSFAYFKRRFVDFVGRWYLRHFRWKI